MGSRFRKYNSRRKKFMNNVTDINEAKKRKKEEYQKFLGNVATAEHNTILEYEKN